MIQDVRELARVLARATRTGAAAAHPQDDARPEAGRRPQVVAEIGDAEFRAHFGDFAH